MDPKNLQLQLVFIDPLSLVPLMSVSAGPVIESQKVALVADRAVVILPKLELQPKFKAMSKKTISYDFLQILPESTKQFCDVFRTRDPFCDGLEH